ncbi:transcription factor DIVARICATA-like [Lotus japonicus]|uniref:Uncharacterized protein n=1 Tax=Lotus japonicus TaxID=34305 RepID=I3STE6_LOTJA|nr:transcription factor DIVARICATA-like [Lotus japonicus]AFK43538.1 unknown [Lotus japonicus]
MDLKTFYSNSNYFVQKSAPTEWTREDNEKFESAVSIYDKDTPDRWLKVAAMIPGKTVFDVIKKFKELEDILGIEAGHVPIPATVRVRGPNHVRKKGVPWTEEEHRGFLMGLQKYGIGDWRNIARNFVLTKTPTQVASHARKYYKKQKVSGDKDRRSIHDITTVNNGSLRVFIQSKL